MYNKPHFLIVAILFSTINISAGEKVRRSEDETDEHKDDLGEMNDEAEDEEFDMLRKYENSSLGCNRLLSSQLHEIRSATYAQFPFMAIVMSNYNEYLCSGVVVSNGLILTTSKCAASYTSYVILNATRDKLDDTTVMLRINRTEKFPSYIGFRTQLDIGLIYIEHHNNICSKISLSNLTMKTVYDVKGLEAVGYGLNTDTGKPKVMQYIGMELRQPVEDLETLTAYFDCVDTKVPTCFKDTGNAVIVDNELIGIVYEGQKECTKEMFSKNSINKKMVDIVPIYTFKPWLVERIKINEEMWTKNSLLTYPDKPDAMKE